MAQVAVLTFSHLAIGVIGLLVLALLVVAWAFFLDAHEHNTTKVRSTLLSILGVATLAELGFSLCGLTHQWVTVVALIVNIWGWLDALLRFHAAHDALSLFATKQLLLLVAKTLSYAFGIIGLRQHIGIFLTVLLMNIWGLPVLYLMAVPVHLAEQPGATYERDMDLIVRVWRTTTCKAERQQCLRSAKGVLHKGLFAVSQRSPMAKFALCSASPAYRRAFSKGCRSV